jgi:polysaccharide pyruvyl transferase WcaK-like protein
VVALTLLRPTEKRTQKNAAAPRVGFFGLLGAGNLGNDGSLEAVLAYLRTEHPDAIVDCKSTEPDQVTARYGFPATQMRWYQSEHERVPIAKCVKVPIGMIVDAFRTASWVRRHDVVIVPGMGVLEAAVPVRPWHTPYAMFLLCASGRLFRTRVALVCVGASVIHQRLTRWLIIAAARLAYYRSYRDTYARDAMRRMGLDTWKDAVYPDLAFSLPTPRGALGVAGAVGVGIMDYHGGNDDRRRADEIHASYVEKMKAFILWLIDNGRPVWLFATDVHDEPVVREVIADVHALRPGLAPQQAIAEPVSSLEELMQRLASVDTVVATRYHNVLCALKLAKPTLSIGYAAKFEALMAEMGLAEFCQSARSLDLDRLIKQFTELENRSVKLQQTLLESNAAKVRLLDHQFATLSAVLFRAAEPARAADVHEPARTDTQFKA